MEEQRAPSIVKIATTYGIIQGVLSFALFVAGTLVHIKQSWVETAVSAAVLIVLMVLAQQKFKATHGGMMTYPQGLGSGTLLSSVGAVVTAILVYGYVKYINDSYVAAALQNARATLQQRGITGAQADQALAITRAITSPVGLFVTSVVAGVIVGFIVALIVSIFTQKGDPTVVV